jgi:predicted phosphodiesterase
MDVPIGKLLFVHGSPSEPTYGYVYPDSDLSVFTTAADIVFMGHSHYPFIRKFEKTTYINVGSCGLPRDDGRYGAAALFNPNTGEIKIVRFDIRDLTVQSFAESPVVHAAVKDLFDRRQKKTPFGELYEV